MNKKHLAILLSLTLILSACAATQSVKIPETAQTVTLTVPHCT